MLDFLSDEQLNGLCGVLEKAKSIGLLGPGDVTKHISHARNFSEAMESRLLNALDLGSGGGLPGLVLAYVWPETSITLLDASERRTSFLRWAVGELRFQGRVDVCRGRAEELAREDVYQHHFDVVTSRGFGPAATTAECASRFLRRGGKLLVSEPTDQANRWSEDGLSLLNMKKLDCRNEAIAVIEQLELTPPQFPRRSGIPRKRPLFNVSRET